MNQDNKSLENYAFMITTSMKKDHYNDKHSGMDYIICQDLIFHTIMRYGQAELYAP